MSLRRLPVDIRLHVLLVKLWYTMVDYLQICWCVVGRESLAALCVGDGDLLIVKLLTWL